MKNTVGLQPRPTDSRLFVNPKNPSKEDDGSYTLDFFRLVDSYINLITSIHIIRVNRGLVSLYEYRTGSVSSVFTPPDTIIKSDTDKTLTKFANSCIIFNIMTLYTGMIGDLNTQINNGAGNRKCLSSEVVRIIRTFIGGDVNRTSYDNIETVTVACQRNSYLASSSVESVETILDLIERLDSICRANHVGVSFRDVHLPILKIMFEICLNFYGIDKFTLRTVNENRPLSKSSLMISDTTLATIPFAPAMTTLCAHESSAISRQGIEFIESLEIVLRRFAGVQRMATS